MAVKDRTKPIQAVTTKSPAKYLGPQTLLGLTRHIVQVSCEGVLFTAWLTDEDFEKGFENVPEPESRPLVDPTKPIRLRREAWTDHALLMAEKVECVQCIAGYRYFVRIEWMDGRIREEWWKEDIFQESFENVPEESPVASECDNGAAPEPHKGNGKADREIDWAGEVECRLRGADKWVPFRVCFRSNEFDDLAYGVVGANRLPTTCRTEHWEFRNKPEPDRKWESTGDDRLIDCERKTTTLWLVWLQWPGAEFPTVAHANPWRIKALGFQQDLIKHGLVAPGTRFVISSCKAPVMPEATEADA